MELKFALIFSLLINRFLLIVPNGIEIKCACLLGEFQLFLLIVPNGIEISSYEYFFDLSLLLIVPNGIEMLNLSASKSSGRLLIVPNGIEIEAFPACSATITAFNRTKWN